MMLSSEVTPEEFVKTVLYATKHDFSAESKFIPKTRAVKLVCMVADEVGYDGFARGWYKYGYFSFKVHSILEDIHVRKNLYSTKIEKKDINSELLPSVIPVIKEFKSKFIAKRKDFLHWVHIDLPPSEYQRFYKFSDEFLLKCENLPTASGFSFLDPYDDISETITNYNTCLNHVKRENLELFFSFSDIIEDILLINKQRNLKFTGLKRIITELFHIFENDVYSCLPPFVESVEGQNKGQEIEIFEENSDRRSISAKRRIKQVTDDLVNKDLIPSLEEFDREILSNLEKCA